jgi:hypothetical protein
VPRGRLDSTHRQVNLPPSRDGQVKTSALPSTRGPRTSHRQACTASPSRREAGTHRHSPRGQSSRRREQMAGRLPGHFTLMRERGCIVSGARLHAMLPITAPVRWRTGTLSDTEGGSSLSSPWSTASGHGVLTSSGRQSGEGSDGKPPFLPYDISRKATTPYLSPTTQSRPGGGGALRAIGRLTTPIRRDDPSITSRGGGAWRDCDIGSLLESPSLGLHFTWEKEGYEYQKSAAMIT